MKKILYLFLTLVLAGCEDTIEDIHRFSRIKTGSKDYPVYLDMSEIENLRVLAGSPVEAPFKIVSSGGYYFVGDMLKGVHVYEKEGRGASYLCFIECLYIKDFEVAENRLFFNNLTDLVVADVSDPVNTYLLHRKKYHFNRFTSYSEYWNIPFHEDKGLVAGSETHVLTGVVTDEQPDLDFSEYDELYNNLTTKKVPESWFSEPPLLSKPYVGIINPGTGEIHTYGEYNSWAIGTYNTGALHVSEEDLWTPDRGDYAPPYYYSDAFPMRMYFEDDIIFILGTEFSYTSGYIDCIIPNKMFPETHHLYFKDFRPVDACYMPQINAFFTLSGSSLWGVFLSGNATSGYEKTYIDYQIDIDATDILSVENHLITLGDELSVYELSKNELRLVKHYSGINGTCSFTEENLLAVAGIQGLVFYDIADLENIQLIP